MTSQQANKLKSSSEKLDPAIVKMAWILIIGAIMPMLDTTMVNVALHSLSHDFAVSVATIQWVSTIYVLAMGLVIPVSGWAVDYFGGKNTWLFALALFLLGSVLSAIAWNAGSLITFRFLQGVGGGLIFPTMQTMGIRIAGNQNLGKLITLVSLPILFGPIFGPVLGGIIVDSLSWRWIFIVNVPICLFAIAWAWRGLVLIEHKQRPSFDMIGMLLLAPALLAILFGMSKAGAYHRFDHTYVIAPLSIGITLLGIFLIYEWRKKVGALIDLKLFLFPSFSAATFMLFLAGFMSIGSMLLLPLYYQQVKGVSVLNAGLLLIPQGIGGLLVRIIMSKFADSVGPRVLILPGIILTALGTLPFAFSSLDPSHFWLVASLFIRGMGFGAVLIPLIAAAYRGISSEQVSHATSITRTGQQIGGAFGSALLAVILSNSLAQTTISDVTTRGAAFDIAFWWLIGFTVLALLPCVFLKGEKSLL